MANGKMMGVALIFVGSVLCFFLPFATVSCQGVKLFSVSGQQLATGTVVSMPQRFGPPKTKREDANPLAAVAAVCGLAGIILALIGRKMVAASAVAGVIGSASLLLMRGELDQHLQREGMGVCHIDYQIGYTLALLLFIAGAAWSCLLFLKDRAKRTSQATKEIAVAG
jgi:energy-converting hydrogenase Eha subunit E